MIGKKAADGICDYVERLASAKRFGVPVDYEAASWLMKIGNTLHERLDAGLATPRHAIPAVTLAGIIDRFISRRESSVKAGTRLVWTQARRHLLAAFSADRPATNVTPADADDFRRKLRADYSEAYTAMMIATKGFYRDAVRRKTLAESPFADTATVSQRNPERFRFIDLATIAKCIDAAPDAEWRLLFALARYGGLRVPSEPPGLRWADVD